MKKTALEVIDEYKFKTMMHVLKEDKLFFKNGICTVYKDNALVSCPSWTNLKGTFNNFFTEDGQLELFDREQRMREIIFSIVSEGSLAFFLDFAKIEESRLDTFFNWLSNYSVTFNYSSTIGKIKTFVADDCPIEFGGITTHTRYPLGGVEFQPLDNVIFSVFKFLKTLTADDVIRASGKFRVFHNHRCTAFQLNCVIDEKQREIITATSFNRGHHVEPETNEAEAKKEEVAA